MAKQSKSVVISVTPHRITLMWDGTTSHKYWCAISTNVIFCEFVMEGVTNTNEFRIETNPGSLSRIMKLVNNATKSLTIRLSKSTGQPVLNIAMEVPGLNTHLWREVSHNIQINIIARRLYSEYDKQQYPVHVLFDMTNMPEFAATAHKIKSLGRRATISLITTQQAGDQPGPVRTMAVSSGIPGCNIRSVFKNVRSSSQTGVPLCDDVPADPNLIEIDVESKLLFQFLNAFRKRNVNLTIGIKLQNYVTFYMSGTDFTIDYLMPCLKPDF